MSAPNDIIHFHYPYSPYARRITWYLTLRGLEHAECIQPPVLPRPILNSLGINYRRIPVLSIGRDIYCDTRLILQKLEEKFSEGAIGAQGADQKAIERLLSKLMIDAGVFPRAASLIPVDMPIMSDPKFLKDRESLSGRSWNKEDLKRGQPESIVHIRDAFELLETTLLADGRDWILKTEKPSLADIEGIWPFDWLVELKALPPKYVSETQFPKVYAWIRRFRTALKTAKASRKKAQTLKGTEAVKHVINAGFAETGASIDENDPLGLKQGSEVEVWPIDSGFSHHDRGRLVTLTPNEVTLASATKEGGTEVHIHFPRWGFRVAKAADRSGARPLL